MGVRILVVDDDPLLAFELAELLKEAAFDVVGPALTVSEALRLIDTEGCDLAVLDFNLGREVSAPIASKLRTQNLRFVALSGYTAAQLPSEFDGAPTLPKPVRGEDLIFTLHHLLRLG